MQCQKPRRLWCAVFLFAAACNVASGQLADNSFAPAPPAGEPEAGSRVPRVLEYAVPVAMFAYGAASLRSGSLQSLDCKARDRLVERGRCIDSKADNFLAPAPAVAAFALKAFGVKSKSTTTDMLVMYGLGNVAQAGVVFGAKSWAKRERPDASDCNSFPSAHTAIAFTAAEFLHQEYGRKSPWISIGGYAAASAVAASRVLNNKHWASDVVAGAGIGILSTKTVYWLYPSLKQKVSSRYGKKTQTLILPDYSNGMMKLRLVRSF